MDRTQGGVIPEQDDFQSAKTLILLHAAHDAERGEDGEFTPEAVAKLNALANQLEGMDEASLTEAERKDKLGRSMCYDDISGIHIPCPKQDDQQEEKKASKVPSKQSFEWGGVIEDENRIEPDEDSYRRGSSLASYNDHAGSVEVRLQRGHYDPGEDATEYENVWRWVAIDEQGDVIASGDWTADKGEAKDAGSQHAEDSDQGKPDAESEDESEDVQVSPPQKRKVMLASKKMSRSNADIAVHTSVDEPRADRIVKSIFGSDKSGGWVPLMESLGMPDDAECLAVAAGRYETLYSDDSEMNAVGVRIKITHPKLVRASRFVGVDEDGNRFVKNEVIEIKPEYQGEGLGADIFTKQVEASSEEGIDYIVTHAAKGEKMNGYYTWPRFGYDMALDDPSVPDVDKPIMSEAAKLFNAKTVLDVMQTPEGREWWKKNGTDLHNARFDLTPGSRSMKVLESYVKERESRAAK